MLVRATRRLTTAPLRALLAVVLVLGNLLVPVQSLTQVANAQTQTGPIITVTNTLDPGTGTCTVADCSLHDAIILANSLSGANTINFSIAGAAPHVITTNAGFPTITDPVTIDGLNGGPPRTSWRSPASSASPAATTPPPASLPCLAPPPWLTTRPSCAR